MRSPHHTTSLAGLTGGGVPLLPGEISLAHLGVLFLDELPEFTRNCLEALRQPLEKRSITITRASGSFHFPAQFSLVAAANPCPCGFLGSTQKVCRCTRQQRHSYTSRISGPLLDRIDLHVWTAAMPLRAISQAQSVQNTQNESSAAVAERVAAARKLQQQRFRSAPSAISCNAELTSKQIKQYCQLSKQAKNLLTKAGQVLHLSARGYTRTIKVSQTIADLAKSPSIEEAHVAEALQFRANIWGEQPG
jgi:magnesium chelatase family protein